MCFSILAVANQWDNCEIQPWVLQTLFVFVDLSRFYFSKVSTRDLTCSSFWTDTCVTHVSVKCDISSTCAVGRTCALINSWNLAQVCRSLRSQVMTTLRKHNNISQQFWMFFWVHEKLKNIATACLFQRLALALRARKFKKMTSNFQNVKKMGSIPPCIIGSWVIWF